MDDRRAAAAQGIGPVQLSVHTGRAGSITSNT